MRHLHRFSIGATAAIITSMGLIAGLTQGAGMEASTIVGLLILALADNVSDSLSIHIYKESEGASRREVRISTLGNFIVRMCVAFTFIGIVLALPPYAAFVVSSFWGLFLLAVISYEIAKQKETHPAREIALHLAVALAVIVGSKFLGNLILGAAS